MTALAIVVGCAVVLLGILGWDDFRTHHDVGQQAQRANDATRQLAASQARGRQLAADLATVRAQNGQLQSQARYPTLDMWNSCGGPCTVNPSAVRVGSVPDTFELQVEFTSDVPIHTYVFTFHQWTQFDGCGFSARCVSGSYTAYAATTSLKQTFADAEGCSGYVWVLQADGSGTIQPDVKISYRPADHPTGVCAQSP